MSSQNYPWLEHYADNVDWHMDIVPRLMSDVFDETVARKPSDQAFDFMGKTYTWSELQIAVNKFAAGLQAYGIGKGQKVGIFLPNCPTFLIAYYGILKTGATVVNYNPLYAEAELAHQITDSDTEIMVSFDLEMLYEKMEKKRNPQYN